MSYAALTPDDRQAMLQTIGVDSIDDLFADIPRHLRQNAQLGLEAPLPEMPLRARMNRLAALNTHAESAACFLGAGSYDHYIPAVVPALAGRGEFATSYTPYQAEVSQGTLQVIYEFQTLLCQLTQMEMANASLYDGATALAEALLMARAVTKRNRFLLPRALSPFYKRVVETYLQGLPISIDTIPFANGVCDWGQLDSLLSDDVAAVVVQQPNFFGSIEDAHALGEMAHRSGALLVSVFNPATLGLLPPPGAYDADIAVGEGQPLGLGMNFGGPGVGLFCCRKSYARFAPGRLVGQTTDEEGRDGFTLTLQTREQHIRRDRATSNICTNQALCALSASIYLSAMGPQGLRELGAQCHAKAHYAAQVLSNIDGCELVFASPFFHEFALKLPAPVREVNSRLHEYSCVGGYDLGGDYPELQNVMLVCCTEKRTREEIDDFARALKEICTTSR